MGAFSLSGSKVRRHIPGLGGNGYDMGFILPQADKRVHHQPESRTVSRSRRRGKEWEQDDGRHQRVVVQRLMGLDDARTWDTWEVRNIRFNLGIGLKEFMTLTFTEVRPH